ncbi:hypothetical protein AJ88_00555 [Mesorhizobium amorphae CCBAU 01583]|nr:hypothetical protein AJ88_00555 [Mesorhizobium amorphae CCBAU 01583]
MVRIVAREVECKKSHQKAAHRMTIPFDAGFYAVCIKSQLVARRTVFMPPCTMAAAEVRTAKIVWLACAGMCSMTSTDPEFRKR